MKKIVLLLIFSFAIFISSAQYKYSVKITIQLLE